MGTLDKSEAIRISTKLQANPVAPGVYSHFINVGTNSIIDALENHYFRGAMSVGISSFKYLQGYYGSGKTQFIHSLAARAWQNSIVTSIANIGIGCPFNSPLAIYQAVVSNMIPAPEPGKDPDDERGIEVVFRNYINQKLKQYGIASGKSIPPEIRQLIEQPFTEMYIGAPDMQAAMALQQLGKLMLDVACGGATTPAAMEIISWIRGDDVKSKYLREMGLHKPVKDDSAFNRLKTVILFMTKRMGMKGFLIAFDEGTRTVSFRRGSIKQKQAIENMLTMINDGADDKFPGVMFLYAATPDFRNEVIQKYPALNDRIGNIAFKPGSPIVPFIDLDSLDTRSIIREIGTRLLYVFSVAYGIQWNHLIQSNNIERLMLAEEKRFGIGSEIRRSFVFHFCILMEEQKMAEFELSDTDAEKFLVDHVIPQSGDRMS
ncbi:MAG: BREX system ATP-binding domain-containing protein [Desulfatirhabdiaceae bacterium]